MTTVSFCSHAGNTNVGTQAPPSITNNRVVTIARPRVASGVLPSAAISNPQAAVIRENAAQTPRNPAMLPWMRTPKTTRAKANSTISTNIEVSAALVARLPSSTPRDSGAARRRFHTPVWRCISKPMPTSIPRNRMNWMPIPPKECAYPLYVTPVPEVTASARTW